MKVATKVNNIVSKLKPGIIYDYSLFNEFENRNALYVSINRLIGNGLLKKAAKGKFFIVTKNENYKDVDLKEATYNEILKDGVEIGFGLYNKIGLILEKTNTVEVITPNIKAKYKKQFLGTHVVYHPIRFQLTTEDKRVIEFLEVLKDKNRIKELIYTKYVKYVKSFCNKLNSSQNIIDSFTKLFDMYQLRTKIDILTNIEKIDYKLASKLTKYLKAYQIIDYKKSIENNIESRIFILLNKNIEKEYEYTKEEVNLVFTSKSYKELNTRDKKIFDKIFREFNSFDFELLKRDFYININNIKKIFLNSPYANNVNIYSQWKEPFNIKDEFKEKIEKSFERLSSKERIERLRNKTKKVDILPKGKYKLNYITGKSSFNIPYNGILCDWHQYAMLKADKYVTHPSKIIGAEDIFGEYGLHDCREFFKENNKDITQFSNTNLCANPIRAILDILYNYIVILNKNPNLRYDEYMFEELDKKELVDKINILNKNLTIEQKRRLTMWRSKYEV